MKLNKNEVAKLARKIARKVDGKTTNANNNDAFRYWLDKNNIDCSSLLVTVNKNYYGSCYINNIAITDERVALFTTNGGISFIKYNDFAGIRRLTNYFDNSFSAPINSIVYGPHRWFRLIDGLRKKYNVSYEIEESGNIARGKCGDNLTWTLNTNGELVIDGTGPMTDIRFASDCHSWYNYRDSIKTIKIESGVTTIGNRAFEECENVESINIPKSILKIGIKAFRKCYNLKYITVDKNNIEYSNDKYGVLFNKDKTKIIQYPTGRTSKKYIIPDGVITIGNSTFQRCNYLKEVVINNQVTSIEEDAFSYCKSLTNIKMPNSVTNIDNEAFLCCSDLASVEVGNSVKHIPSYAFAYCNNLTNINIPSSVTSIDDSAFAYCDNIKNIFVDSGNAYYSNDEHGTLFNKDKTKLVQYTTGDTRKSYHIPDYVTSIGGFAFSRCNNLTEVTIADNVTQIERYTFSHCGLTKVIIKSHFVQLEGDVFHDAADGFTICGAKYSTAQAYAEEYNHNFIETEVETVTAISGKCGDNLVWELNSNGVFTISGIGKMNYDFDYSPWRFYYERSIVFVKIKDGVTNIGNDAFYGCSNLKTVDIPNTVTEIGNCAFLSCDNLDNVVIPNSVTTIGRKAFAYCKNFTKANVLAKKVSFAEKVFEETSENLIIEGNLNSTAKTYAIKNNHKFVEINN